MPVIQQRSSKKKKLSEKIRVRETNMGKGVFARQRFRKGQIVGEATGKIIISDDYDSRHCVELSNDQVLEPAAPFRYLNHSCEPNCELFSWEPDERWRRKPSRLCASNTHHSGGRRANDRLRLASGCGNSMLMPGADLPWLDRRYQRVAQDPPHSRPEPRRITQKTGIIGATGLFAYSLRTCAANLRIGLSGRMKD